MTNSIMGMKVIPCLWMADQKYVRVLGGYKNRWWIRVLAVVPRRNFIYNPEQNAIYMHPAMLNELKISLNSNSFRPTKEVERECTRILVEQSRFLQSIGQWGGSL